MLSDARTETAVLFVARGDLLTNPGGDTTQILSTKAAIERAGAKVDLLLMRSGDASALVPRLARASIVHVFNLLLAHQYEHVLHEAKDLGIPVVLSPVYWDMHEFEHAGEGVPGWKRLILSVLPRLRLGIVDKTLRTHFKSASRNPAYRALLSDVLARVDLLLPNSHIEERMLRDSFPAVARAIVVPNACRTWDGPITRPSEAPAKYILCAGRIERRKNQANLIRALPNIGMPLVLLGNVNLAERAYWDECKSLAARLGVSLLHVPGQQWGAVWSWYSHATVHVQPSWFETPGLTSLEAAAAGCPIVCTAVGSAREYFGDLAEYCQPGDAVTIRQAVEKALQHVPAHAAALRTHVRQYSWDGIGYQTLMAYGTLLPWITAARQENRAVAV